MCMSFRVLCAWHKEEQIIIDIDIYLYFFFLVIINRDYDLYIAQMFNITFTITVFRNTFLTPTLTTFLE